MHFHDCFDLEKVFTSAYRNFEAEAERLGAGKHFAGILLLAETSRAHWFDRLFNYADGMQLPNSKNTGKWSIHHTGDDGCLEARAGDAQKLYLMAGRQIVTVENLEVLALLTVMKFEDGQPLEQVLGAVKESGAISVIPWGFGKWMGKRGRILENFLVVNRAPLFLGDNGGRPSFWPRPRLFAAAEGFGGRVFPGSDPLPFKSEVRKIARFGFSVNCTFDSEQPATSLKRVLRDSSAQLEPYGPLERPMRFLLVQFAMFLRKYFHIAGGAV
jgi:hypothetical protein